MFKTFKNTHTKHVKFSFEIRLKPIDVFTTMCPFDFGSYSINFTVESNKLT